MYFSHVPLAPADPIFLLSEKSAKDQRSSKIDLSMGLYYDEEGKLLPLKIIQKVTEIYQAQPTNHLYLGIAGHPQFIAKIPKVTVGQAYMSKFAVASVQCVGGTGGLRVVGDYLKVHHAQATVWLSTPTWVNHEGIFHAAGMQFAYYPYYDAKAQAISFDALIQTIETKAKAKDVILLHACCHNPTGVDFSVEQWVILADLLAKKEILPVFDMAYQGFGDGLMADLKGIHTILDRCEVALICNSFSKNMGLYGERVGGLTVVSVDQQATLNVISQLKACMRANYSNPPRHGATLASLILNDDAHFQAWQIELETMRQRVVAARVALKQGLDSAGLILGPGDNDFLVNQKGMFSLLNFNTSQLTVLREQYGVYLVDGGRINLAGLQMKHIPSLCEAFKAVI
jgi:aspartate/tyrosine/aromatic aminotransferase